MSEFKIKGWDFVPEPADEPERSGLIAFLDALDAEDEAETAAASDLDRLAPLFGTPGWNPEWHRWLRGSDTFTIAGPSGVWTLCAAAPDATADDPDQPLLDRLAELVVAWRDGPGGDLETTLRACIEAQDAHRGRRP